MSTSFLNDSAAFQSAHQDACLSAEHRRHPLRGRILAAILCCGLTLTAPVCGQPPQRQLPTSSRVDRSLELLRSGRQSGSESDVLKELGRLVTAESSVLVAREGGRQFVPLHRILAEEFERLPAATQESWKKTTGQSARVALRNVIRSAQWTELVDVIHRFPGTETAGLARLLLVRLHLDRGNRLAARHWLQTVTPEASSSNLQRIRQQLQQRLASASPVESSSPSSERVPAEAEKVDWKVRWSQRTPMSSSHRLEIESAQRWAIGTTDASWNGDVRSDAVCRRTLTGLLSTDLLSGDVRWEVRLRPGHLDQITRRPRRPDGGPAARSISDNPRQLLTHHGVLNRIAASDTALYLVTASPAPVGIAGLRLGQMSRDPDARLVAYSRGDGRRLWSAGGPTIETSATDPLAGAWFAGPPLVDSEHLHSIVQVRNEIRLATLRADSGAVLESSLLAFTDFSIDLDPARQYVAVAPVSAGGLLLCPTGTGWMAAVDELTRSVVWVTRTSSHSPKAGTERALRANRQAMGSRFSPDQLPHEIVELQGDTAVVFPWDSREIHFLDIATGETRQQLPVTTRPTFLASLPDAVFVAINTGRRIQRLHGVTGEMEWQRDFTNEDGVPCGAGVIRGRRLMLAMTSGDMIAVDIETGSIVESASAVLRPMQHGRLLQAPSTSATAADETEDDLLFIGLADTVCLTRRSETRTPDATSELVRLQFGSGHTVAAWQALSELPEDVLLHDPAIAALRFEIAFHLAASGRLPPEVVLSDLATRSVERIQAKVAEIQTQGQEDAVAAAVAALKLIEEDPVSDQHRSLLDAVVIPVGLLPNLIRSDGEPDSLSPASNAWVSLRAWAAALTEHALSQSGSRAADVLASPLNALSVETLLQIQHPAIAPAVMTRLSDVTQREHTIHLLQHLRSLKPDAAIPQLSSLSAWQSSDESSVPRDQRQQQYLNRLLSVADIPGTAGVAADGTLVQSDEDQRRREWWDSWSVDDYVTVPFGRPTPSQRQAYRLKLMEPNDPFLRRFNAQIHRSPSRLVLTEAGPDSQLIWSIPGVFPSRPGASTIPTLERAGSLLLIASPGAVSAISLADHRVLWRRVAGARRLRNADSPAPEQTRWDGARLVSFDSRWVCLHTGDAVEVLDALTGRSLWSLPVTLPNKVFASTSCVLEQHGNRLRVVDRRFGRPLPCGLQPLEFHRIVAVSGAEFVFQEPDPDDGKRLRLVWKDAVSGEVSKTVEVSNVAQLQRDTDRQAVAWQNNGRLTVIDLQSGAAREYRWAETAVREDDERQYEDPSEVLSGEWQYFEDPDFVYLIRQNESPQPGGRIPERQLTAWRELRTLDRHTGRRLWQLSLPESRFGTVVTDQLNLPFVAFIDQIVPTGRRIREGGLRFRCIAKRDGKLLIQEQLPSRYTYGELRISTAEDHAVSVEIHGTHVRFERPETLSVRRADTDAAADSGG